MHTPKRTGGMTARPRAVAVRSSRIPTKVIVDPFLRIKREVFERLKDFSQKTKAFIGRRQ